MDVIRKRRVTCKEYVSSPGSKNEWQQFVGWFHCWGSEGLELNDGGGITSTVAIVEKDDGHVAMIHPTHVRFHNL